MTRDADASPLAGLLGPEHIALIDQGVSTIVASCDATCRPSLMRAVGTHLDAATARITVFVARSQSRQLLLDIAATGRLAVVFSEPSSHRSLQVKSRHAEMRPAVAADRPIIERYLASMEREIGRVGFSPDFVRAMLDCELEDLVAIEFTPHAAYDQTPGPRAGAALSALERALP